MRVPHAFQPFVCVKLQSENKFNHKNENKQQQRRTAEGDQINNNVVIKPSQGSLSSFSRVGDNILGPRVMCYRL